MPFRVWADSKYSKTYNGRVNHGTYGDSKIERSRMHVKVLELKREGYENIEVTEVDHQD